MIEPIILKVDTGFNVVEKYYFMFKEKKVRNLSNIGYRLLNFISYSHLFFSFCIGNIHKNNLDQYLIKNCNILDIIEIDWNLLKEELQKKI